MAEQLYAAKDARGVTLGNVVAESVEDAREFFASGTHGRIGFETVVRADHIGPHTPYCPNTCVA